MKDFILIGYSTEPFKRGVVNASLMGNPDRHPDAPIITLIVTDRMPQRVVLLTRDDVTKLKALLDKIP